MRSAGETQESKMPRDYFDYSREKLVSFNRQIHDLLSADFPIPRTRVALENIRVVFEAQLQRIDSLGIVSDVIRRETCAHINVMIKKFLPLLGFILRSTNVRNSFELTDPITRLSKHLFQKELVFILSSEWEFSPLTYSLSFQELPDVILLGLPSFELANALVIPLAGHELGHWIWREEDISTKIARALEENVLNVYIDNWNDFRTIFWDKDVGNIRTDIQIRDVWLSSYNSAIHQLEEIFTDFVGLKLFGESYLHSFEYLLAPSTGEFRWRDYPGLKTRAEFLEKAAAHFGISTPTNYSRRFDNPAGISDPADRFLTDSSDAATSATIDSILACVDELSVKLQFPRTSNGKIAQCLQCIRNGVPAEGMDYIGNIINAGWMAYLDATILPWSETRDGRRIDALNEILLKSIEVVEFEARMKADDAANR